MLLAGRRPHSTIKTHFNPHTFLRRRPPKNTRAARINTTLRTKASSIHDWDQSSRQLNKNDFPYTKRRERTRPKRNDQFTAIMIIAMMCYDYCAEMLEMQELIIRRKGFQAGERRPAQQLA